MNKRFRSIAAVLAVLKDYVRKLVLCLPGVVGPFALVKDSQAAAGRDDRVDDDNRTKRVGVHIHAARAGRLVRAHEIVEPDPFVRLVP